MQCAEANGIDLTEFEILTAVMFKYFADNEVDVVVLETGLGGRFDATNVIKKNYEIDDITKKIDSLIQKRKVQSSTQLINLKEISSNSDTNLKVVKQKEIEHSNTNVMLQKVKEEIQRQKELLPNA